MDTDNIETMEPAQLPRRTYGKIPALPHEVRTFVNESLRDGLQYTVIVAQLEAKGFPGITIQNLSYWYQTGYQRWLGEVERMETLRVNSQTMLSLSRNIEADEKDSFNEFAKYIMDSQIIQVLQQFDPQRLTELLADQPERFFSLANILASRCRDRQQTRQIDLQLQKYRDQIAEQKRLLDEATKPKPGGISPEAMAQIRKAIDSM